jgi:hypothetical protein
MYGPIVAGVQFTLFIEIAATGDILVISGMPFLGDLQDHDVIPSFATKAMADDFVQRSEDDGHCQPNQWVVVTYPQAVVGRAKVVASGATHFAAIETVQPFQAHAVPTAGVRLVLAALRLTTPQRADKS